MILVGLAGTLMGLLVGVRSEVYALIPTMIGALLVAGLAVLIGDGDSMVTIAIKMGVFLTCLPFGYLGGAVLRLSFDRGTRLKHQRNRAPVPTVHVR